MTKNKIKPTISQVVYCLKAGSERYPEVCEECQLYGEVGCDHCYDDVTDMAIKSLKELEQHRAIGTVKEVQCMKDKQTAKARILSEGKYYCPVCGHVAEMGYCKACGQNLY